MRMRFFLAVFLVASVGCATNKQPTVSASKSDPERLKWLATEEGWAEHTRDMPAAPGHSKASAVGETRTPQIALWVNYSLLRSLCERAGKGDIAADQIKELYNREHAQAKLDARLSAYSVQTNSELNAPALPSQTTQPLTVEQSVTINPQYTPPNGSPILQGFAAGSQMAEAATRNRARQAAIEAQMRQIGAYERQMEAYQSALERRSQARERAEKELFDLGMQSRGWSRATKAEADAWIQDLEAAKVIGLKEAPKLPSD